MKIVNSAWKKRTRLVEKSKKLYLKGMSLRAEEITAKTALRIYKMYAESYRAYTEGQTIFLDTVIKELGDVTMEYTWYGECTIKCSDGTKISFK